jgi:ubiquinone/menaquinone biosynthesis C-methylase UbiE
VNGRLYDLFSRRAEHRQLGALRHELLADVEGEILEIGAGTGANLRHYAAAGRVVALEPDPGMAKQLPAKLAEASVPVELVEGRAEALPFPDESFDAVVSTFVLCSVDDPDRALAEIRRVLRPGGRFVVIEHVRGSGRRARWQDRLTGVHRKLAGNCHLNRDTRDAIAAAGFDTSGLREVAFPAHHPLVRPGIQGVATRTSS